MRVARMVGSAAVAGVALVSVGAGTAHAQEGQKDAPPQYAPVVTCKTIGIDPPAWVGVKAVGVVGGHAVNVVLHHVPGTQWSETDATAWTGATGKIHYKVTAWWSLPPNPYHLGSGEGKTVEGDLVCHKAKKVTPKPTTTTTYVRVDAPAVAIAQPAPAAPELPHTGSSTLPLGIAGGTLLAVGAALVGRTKKNGR